MDSQALQSEHTSSPPAGPLAAILTSWQLPLLTAVTPSAIGGTLGAITVIHVFQGMALAGVGGIGAFSMGLYEANRPVIAGLILAAAATLLLGGAQVIASAQKLRRQYLLLCMVLAAAGTIPAILLWRAESFSIAVVAGTGAAGSAGVGQASQHLSTLLVTAAILGLAVPPLVVGVTLILWLKCRRLPPQAASRLQGSAWLLIGVLIASLGAAYCVRSARLHQIAITGHMRSVA